MMSVQQTPHHQQQGIPQQQGIEETSFKKDEELEGVVVDQVRKKDDTREEDEDIKQDNIAWFVSMIFITLVLGAMWIWGNARDWYAQSGYGYTNVNGTGRFSTEPFYCNDTSEIGRHGLPDCTANWYFWKLPTQQTSVLTTTVMWVLYSTHQIFNWALIYKAQLEMNTNKLKGNKKYGNRMRWFNYVLLFINGGFHILHLIQTHWTYDGISQDVSLSSSQASVVLMISLIMLLEYRERGLIFMWPNGRSNDKFAQKLRLNQKPINYVRKYHGYYFSWAIIYTFWYHPMENTWGHTTGFLHTGMVLIQGSLIYTRMHLNKYWRLINESWVLVHGAIVAIQTADPEKPNQLWPMFLFGFGFLLCFTQIFNLPIWKRVSPWFRLLPGLIFYIVAITIYATIIPEGLRNLWQTINIPAIQYLNLILAWFVLYVFIAIENRCNGCYGAPSIGWNIIYLVTILFLYAMIILASILLNYIQVSFLLLMEVYVLAFILLFGVTIMLHKRTLGPFRRNPAVDLSEGQR